MNKWPQGRAERRRAEEQLAEDAFQRFCESEKRRMEDAALEAEMAELDEWVDAWDALHKAWKGEQK